MSRTKGALIGTAIAAALGLADALFIAPSDNYYVPKTTVGLIASYIAFMVPWAAIGAVIGFLVSRKQKPRI